MAPRAAQLPIWMCETWIEDAWSPVIFSSTVSEVGVVVTVIVPLAVAGATPLSLNTNAAGEGVVGGVATAGLGEGEGEGVGVEPVPVLPQAATVITIAASATHLLMLGNLAQVCTRALPVKVT